MLNEEIADYLDLLRESVDRVEKRFSQIRSPKEFVESSAGVTLLDAISIPLHRKVAYVFADAPSAARGFMFEGLPTVQDLRYR